MGTAKAGAPSSPLAASLVIESVGERLLVRLSPELSEALPSRGQVAVRGRCDGIEATMVIEPDGRRGHWLGVSPELAASLGKGKGDTIDLDFTIAEAWPEPEIPADLARALESSVEAGEVWLDITAMARWEWVRWVKATKNPQTRARRVEASISKMLSGKRRPCCFDLSACTDPEVSKSGKLLAPQ